MFNKYSFLPSVAHCIFLAVFVSVTFFDGQRLLSDCDTGYHIRAGEYIIKSLSIPKYDIFSYLSPPIPWTAHEWLTEVIMAMVHQYFGLTGIVIFFAALIGTISSLIYKILKCSGKDTLLIILLTIFTIIISRIHWLARPHLFSWLLFLIWYYILDSYEYRAKNYLYVLPAIMLLWVNLHGSFIAAFAITGIYFISNALKMLVSKKQEHNLFWNKAKWYGSIMVIISLMALVNPYGYHIFKFPFQLMSSTCIMNNVSEFVSTPLYRYIPFTLFFYVIIVLFAVSKTRLNLTEVLLLVLFTHMTLYSVRFVPLFAMITAPIILRLGNDLWAETRLNVSSFLRNASLNIAKFDSAARGIVVPFIVFIVLCLFIMNTSHYSFDSKTKPVYASEFLKTAQLQGNMFNHREFGDYIIYRLWPQYHVFADGRSDMYGEERLKAYFRVERIEPGWRDILDNYKINWIIHEANSMLTTFLLQREDWKIIYIDNVASIFVRNIPENQYLINKYAHAEK